MVSLLRLGQCGTSQINEDGMFELVRTKPGNKTSYEPPSVEKKTKRKENQWSPSASWEKISLKVICHN